MAARAGVRPNTLVRREHPPGHRIPRLHRPSPGRASCSSAIPSCGSSRWSSRGCSVPRGEAAAAHRRRSGSSWSAGDITDAAPRRSSRGPTSGSPPRSPWSTTSPRSTTSPSRSRSPSASTSTGPATCSPSAAAASGSSASTTSAPPTSPATAPGSSTSTSSRSGRASRTTTSRPSSRPRSGSGRRMDRIPTTIYRPAIVVGDSRTGETQKFDGPYYVLRFIDASRRAATCRSPTSAAAPRPSTSSRSTSSSMRWSRSAASRRRGRRDRPPLRSEPAQRARHVRLLCRALRRPRAGLIPVPARPGHGGAALEDLGRLFGGVPRRERSATSTTRSATTPGAPPSCWPAPGLRCPRFASYAPAMVEFFTRATTSDPAFGRSGVTGNRWPRVLQAVPGAAPGRRPIR